MSGRRLRAAYQAYDDKPRTENSRSDISENFRPRRWLPGMRAEKLPRLAEAAGENDMENKADEHEGAARHREKHLLAAMRIGFVLAGCSGPGGGTHPRPGNRLEDSFLCHVAGVVSDGHPAVQDVKGQPFAAANQWSDSLPQHGGFLGTVEAAHLVSAARAKPSCLAGLGQRGATGVCAMSMRVIVMMVVLLHRFDM